MSVTPRRRTGCGLVFGIALALTVAACSTSGEAPRPKSINIADQPFPTKVTANHDDVQMPWHLIRIDTSQDRVYLSASTSHCTTPAFAVVTENADRIAITVFGSGPAGGQTTFCTASNTTLAGYVDVRGGLGGRNVVHG